jgi:hypothetical protein
VRRPSDLYALLDQVDVARVVEEALHRAEDARGRPANRLRLMVGVGARSRELVSTGGGVHLRSTSPGASTPIPMEWARVPRAAAAWVAHEGPIRRYTSPARRASCAAW